VYTDYFVKGRQPTTLCPLHPGGDYATGLAATQGTSPPPQPQPTSGAASVPASPQPTPTPGVSGGVIPSPPQPPPSEQPKKKGFWRKIFGGGRGGGE